MVVAHLECRRGLDMVAGSAAAAGRTTSTLRNSQSVGRSVRTFAVAAEPYLLACCLDSCMTTRRAQKKHNAH